MPPSKTANVSTWIVTGLAAFAFLASGAMKVMSNPQAVGNFHGWGMSDSFLLFVGVAEILGAIGLLIPATATLAASGLSLIMVGAIFTHLTHAEISHAPVPLVLLAMTLFLAVERRHEIGKLWNRSGPSAHAA